MTSVAHGSVAPARIDIMQALRAGMMMMCAMMMAMIGRRSSH